jgi:hypothetical protein
MSPTPTRLRAPRWRAVLATFAAGLALAALVPTPPSAHSGPPATYHRCTYRPGGGSAWGDVPRNDLRASALVRQGAVPSLSLPGARSPGRHYIPIEW